MTRRTRSDAMAGVGVYDQLKKVLQDVIAPDLHAIRADIRSLDQKIDGVDAKLTTKMDALDARLTTKIDALGDKVDDLDVRLTTKIDSLRTETVSLKGELLAEIRRVDIRIDGVDRELRTAIDVRERLAALEARRVSGHGRPADRRRRLTASGTAGHSRWYEPGCRPATASLMPMIDARTSRRVVLPDLHRTTFPGGEVQGLPDVLTMDSHGPGVFSWAR